MNEERNALLAAAATPRRAAQGDAGTLSRLFAAAFINDPIFDWVARPDRKRAGALERYFFWVLIKRAIPYGEVWMSEGVAAAWLPPDVPVTPGGFAEQMKLMPLILRLCGVPRLRRATAMAESMEKNHPKERHFYLAYLAVAPRLQGLGLGGALLEATLARADAKGVPAYLANSNPKNAKLYERAGFVAKRDIAPPGAPPLIAMWRPAKEKTSGE